MNKKEIAEIKKNFNGDSGLFTLNRVVMAYINSDTEVKCRENKLFAAVPDEEAEVVYETLKKALSGSQGKNLTEYAFPNESYEEGGAQNIFYKAMKSKLEDEEAVDAAIDRIRQNYRCDSVYCIMMAHCTYNVMTKDKNDDITELDDNVYNFIITALCPMNTNTDGLFYNSDSNTIEKKDNTQLIISRAPVDGFLYPVFSDRAPDANHVLYYTKTPKKPSLTMIEDVLDCSFSMTAESEKEKFQQVLGEVAGDELDYTVITRVNEIIKDVVAQNTSETEPTMIDDTRLRSILSDAGVSNERLEGLSAAYNSAVGEDSKGFTATNLVENKTVVSTSEITINIGKDATEKLRTGVIQGRKCLIIDLDDPSIKVNGFDASVETPLTVQ
ncbi:MAG: DUF4317 domain-containing protein [Oscillospiraceae bacterium]